jgi:hypothetical protein
MKATLDLSRRLKAFRQAHKMTSRSFKNIGIDSSTISRIENGKPCAYETGKALEEFMQRLGEPLPCKTCNGKGWL